MNISNSLCIQFSVVVTISIISISFKLWDWFLSLLHYVKTSRVIPIPPVLRTHTQNASGDTSEEYGGEIVKLTCDGSYDFYFCCSTDSKYSEEETFLTEKLTQTHWWGQNSSWTKFPAFGTLLQDPNNRIMLYFDHIPNTFLIVRQVDFVCWRCCCSTWGNIEDGRGSWGGWWRCKW